MLLINYQKISLKQIYVLQKMYCKNTILHRESTKVFAPAAGYS